MDDFNFYKDKIMGNDNRSKFARFTIKDAIFKSHNHNLQLKEKPIFHLYLDEEIVFSTNKESDAENEEGIHFEINQMHDFDFHKLKARPDSKFHIQAFDQNGLIGKTNTFFVRQILKRINTGDQFQDIQLFGEQNRFRPVGKVNYSFKFILGGDGQDPDTSADKTLNNISRSYEDAEQAFNEVDISPEMREYINKVWDQYDVSKDGELELYEAKKLMNDIVSQVEGEEV